MSDRLKKLFLFSTFLWIAHGVEELATGLYAVDSHVHFMFGFVNSLTPIHAAFLVFQFMLWLMLVLAYLLMLGPKWQLRLMIIPGLVLVYELHHWYKAIEVGGYYPGLITALAFPIVAFFFWKELVTNFKRA
jgi:hypothetical protein